MLTFRPCGEVAKIHSIKPEVELHYRGERSPQCTFPVYANNKKLKGLKCSEIASVTVFELQTADLLSKPRAPFFRASNRAT
jgi:hypothetical protein